MHFGASYIYYAWNWPAMSVSQSEISSSSSEGLPPVDRRGGFLQPVRKAREKKTKIAQWKNNVTNYLQRTRTITTS